MVDPDLSLRPRSCRCRDRAGIDPPVGVSGSDDSARGASVDARGVVSVPREAYSLTRVTIRLVSFGGSWAGFYSRRMPTVDKVLQSGTSSFFSDKCHSPPVPPDPTPDVPTLTPRTSSV